MSGGSKKVTVGYWHRLLQHWGLCKGPIDAFLEFRAGGRTAWSGVLASSGSLSINQENLWGGKKSEGGISGQLDVQFGEVDQPRNDYLVSRLGDNQPAYRGKVSAVWRGGRWGINPYPKEAAFKVRRILKGWDNDQCWYPEKAEIPLLSAKPLALYFALDVSASMATITSNGLSRMDNLKTAISAAMTALQEMAVAAGLSVDIMIVDWGIDPDIRGGMMRRACTASEIADLVEYVNGLSSTSLTYFPAGLLDMPAFFDGAPADSQRLAFFVTDGIPSASDPSMTQVQIAEAAAALVAARPDVDVHGINIDLADTTYTAYIDNTPTDGVPVVAGGNPEAIVSIILSAISGALIGMNPAHILYDSLVAHDMQNEPVGMINDASFRAAADKLHAEGFGLCTTFDGSEDIEAFQQRICDVIGACLTQSRVDGQYYLDLVRGDYDVESLPVIGSDDIIDCVQEPTGITEVVNQVIVEWYDPQNAEDRATQPVQALGAIQAAGGVIGETRSYPEIPVEGLALRVAARDLQARSTPLSKLTLTTNRRPWKLRPGQCFRLQFPEEGIADMVCLVGDIDTGTLTDGRLRITAVQDVFGMPDTVYVSPEFGNVTPESARPTASPHQRLIEAPYVEMALTLSTADLAAVPPDAGALMAMAGTPSNGLDYALYSAGEGEELVDSGMVGDWCPSALVVEAAGYLDTAFTLTGGTDLADVDVGTWALWDDEIVRVDAIDPLAGTLQLGRGCADTVPATHAAGARIWFCGEFGATDEREYVDGETVTAKLLTRTGAAEQALGGTATLTVTMGQRHYRPYPPGAVKINSAYYPEDVQSPVGIVWSTRNRLTQADKLFDWLVDSITPEEGTTYDVEVRGVDGSLVASSYDLVSAAVTFETSYSGLVDLLIRTKRAGLSAWQDFTHQFQLGTAYFSAKPELRGGVSSFGASAGSTYNVSLPAGYEAGDYLIVAISLPTTTFPAVPAGWDDLAIVTGMSDSSVASDSLVRVIGKVASGTEGSTVSITNTVSTTFGAVAIAVKKNTYTAPRGARAVRGSLGTMPSGGLGVGASNYSNLAIHHDPFYPCWGGDKSLYLSILGRKQANDDPSGYPYADFQFGVASDLASVPDARICGESREVAPSLPTQPASYSKSSYASASTVTMAIRGIFPAVRPECIYMFSASSGGSTVTSLSFAQPAGTTAPLVGDLQLLVVMMYGAGSVTLTPPAGFMLVTRFGQRLAIYKRIVTGAETYPDSIGFSSAISVMARIYTFPQDTYDAAAEVLTATASGGSAASIATPARVADSSWDGKANYALRVIVREGIAGVSGNTVTAFPAGVLENRAHAFNQGSAGDRVSFAIAGGVVQGSSAPAETFTFGAGYAWESATIFIKGI